LSGCNQVGLGMWIDILRYKYIKKKSLAFKVYK